MPVYGKNPELGLAPRECVSCGGEFQPYRSSVITCSRACRERYQGPRSLAAGATLRASECELCGTRFEYVSTKLRRFCPTCKPIAVRLAKDRKNAARRLAAQATPEGVARRRAVNRDSALRRYGLTEADHDRLFAEQGGRCAICRDPADPDGVQASSRLHIDHDHATGEVRGLLCTRCNRGLGYFRDDIERLNAAIKYLEKPETRT